MQEFDPEIYFSKFREQTAAEEVINPIDEIAELVPSPHSATIARLESSDLLYTPRHELADIQFNIESLDEYEAGAEMGGWGASPRYRKQPPTTITITAANLYSQNEAVRAIKRDCAARLLFLGARDQIQHVKTNEEYGWLVKQLFSEDIISSARDAMTLGGNKYILNGKSYGHILREYTANILADTLKLAPDAENDSESSLTQAEMLDDISGAFFSLARSPNTQKDALIICNVLRWHNRLSGQPERTSEILSITEQKMRSSLHYSLRDFITEATMDTITEERGELFNSMEELLIAEEAKPGIEMLQPGIDLTLNIIRSIADNTPESDFANQLIDQKEQDAGSFNFDDIVGLANLLVQIYGENDPPILKGKSLVNLPIAIDRLYVQLTKNLPDSPKKEVLKTASHCARMIMEIGVQWKLKQKVITLEDLTIRYPDLPARKIRDLAEEMQRTKSGQHVHEMYMQQRARSKNQAYYGKWTPGKGLLS